MAGNQFYVRRELPGNQNLVFPGYDLLALAGAYLFIAARDFQASNGEFHTRCRFVIFGGGGRPQLILAGVQTAHGDLSGLICSQAGFYRRRSLIQGIGSIGNGL